MKTWAHLTVIGGLAFGCACSCAPQSIPVKGNPLASAVRVQLVERKPVRRTQQFVGRTEPRRAATLRFEVQGLIDRVLVEEGDRVEAGTPIATLVDVDFALAEDIARAQLEESLAGLAMLREGTRKEDIVVAENEYAALLAKAKFSLAEYHRAQTSYENNQIVTKSELDQKRMLFESTRRDLAAAKARLGRARAGPRSQEVQQAEAEVQARGKALELAQRSLEKTVLKSPFSGIVEKQFVDPGSLSHDFPQGSVPVVYLVDVRELDAVFAIPETSQGWFEATKPIEVQSATDPEIRRVGSIVAVGVEAELETGTFELRVRIDNRDQLFPANSVVVHNYTAASEPQLQVPLSAIRRGFNAPPHVLIVTDNDRVERREVVIGTAAQDSAVVEGLEEGERVIIGGGHRVLPGESVRVVVHQDGIPQPAGRHP